LTTEQRPAAPPEAGRPADDDRPDPEATWRSLRRLARRDGFALGLAGYDRVSTRDAAIARLRADLSNDGRRLAVADLSDGGPDTVILDAILAAAAPDHGDRPDAVMVTGIEALIDFSLGGSRAGSTDALADLNLHRDTLIWRVPVPVVIWASPMAMRTLAHAAPDLWHRRAASFDVRGPAGEDGGESDGAARSAELLARLERDHDRDVDEADTADLRRRLPILRETVAEAEARCRDGGRPEMVQHLNWLRIQLGDVARRLGAKAEAERQFVLALDEARATTMTATEASVQRRMAIALDRVGELRFDRGDHNGAEAAFAENLDLCRGLAARDPDDLEARRDLSISLKKIGELRRYDGDLRGAEAAFFKCLEIARALAARDPDGLQCRRDLSISLNRIGDLRRYHGDLKGAEAAFAEGLEISRALAARDPDGLQARRDLSISLNLIGDLRRDMADLDSAEAAFAESLEIARALAARDPDSLQARRHLSISLERIGDLRWYRGDLDGAEAAFVESLEIARALAARDPFGPLAQRDLSISLERIGDLCRDGGDLDGAETAFAESLKIIRALVERVGDQPEALIDLVSTLGQLARTARLRRDRARARALLDEAAAVLADVATRAPQLSIVGRLQTALEDERAALAEADAAGA
jgi:tetratricopeptide (TPR) repeat protein